MPKPISIIPNSIKARLIATVVLSQLLLAAGLVFAGVFYIHERLVKTLDAGMQARAMSLAALVRYDEDASGKVYFDSTLIPASLDPKHPDIFAVWTESSSLLSRSANWPAGLEILPAGREHWNFKWNHVHYRGLRVFHIPVLDREEGDAFRPQTLTVVYASPTDELEDRVQEAGIYIAVSSLLLLGVTVLLALWGIRRGLLPLQTLARQAARVSTHNWELRLPQDVHEITELRPLTESMTEMLGRLQHSFVEQREFMGNAAHELKTPVAVLKSTLQSLLHRPRSSEDYRVGLEHALEDLERLEQLLQWMLRLARAEQWAHGGLRRDLEIIDINNTCGEAVERIRSLAEARHTAIRVSTNGPVPLRADPEDLQLVWINLLENAVRYSPEFSVVEVTVTRSDGGLARVAFEDHGAGIAPSDLPHVFERFYRGDPSRTRATGGFGLGLAIAKALVEAYGGTITAESAPGKGTRMTVELPTAS
jgi:signal transduction histidine kinase